MTMVVEQQTVLDGRYALDELIGQGGMADVYRGTDQLLLRSVAVKLLREVSEPRQRDRFIDEARTLAALNHPGLVTLLDAGFTGDRPYLVLELAEGSTLAQLIPEGGLPPDRVSAIGRQLAEALAYAHRRGVVHRDVKPSNVLLADDRALLVDFGIARLIGTTDHHTRTGDAIGSPAYLSPEQVSGDEITPAADIFSLGLVLLEALTGLRAYTGTAMEAAVARLNTAPPLPTSLDPGWRSLIARMTHRDPANRPSAAEVAVALDGPTAMLAPVPAAAPPVDALEATGELDVTVEAPLHPASTGLAVPPERRRWRPSRGRLVAAGLLVVALAAIGVPVLLSQHQPTDAGTKVPRAATLTEVAARFRAPLAALHRAVSAADAPASVRTRLGRVDAALSARHYPAARRALDGLIGQTEAAQRSGDLGAPGATRVLTAARHLLAVLPGSPTVVTTPNPSPDKPRHKRVVKAPPAAQTTPAAPATSTPPSSSPTTAPTPSAPPDSPSSEPSSTAGVQGRTAGSPEASPTPGT
jgi:tRNA A-37 threonylcarbamoyl transferase component Bud32